MNKMTHKVSFNEEKQVEGDETAGNDDRTTIGYVSQDSEGVDIEVCDPMNHKSDQERHKEFIAGLSKQQMEHHQMGVESSKGRLFYLSKACSTKAKGDALKTTRAQYTISIIDSALELLFSEG